MPLISYSSSGSTLTRGIGGNAHDSADSMPYARTCHSDALLAHGVWRLLRHFGWKQVAHLHEESEAGRLFSESLQETVE